ncbi:MAG: lysine--tRNA ligase [Candidatus Eisenbacteria bacterium]|nr:lysine--tRNA ligase [Candidatus Eisenbacteria bacterium]
MGIDPYPARFDRDRTAVEIRDRFDEFAEAGTPVSPAGRIMTIRRMGKACFAHLRDRTGTIQLYLRRDNVGEEAYNAWKRLEPGDWVGATGAPFRTKTGEMSIDVSSFTVLSKSLLPLPEKWHGLTNKEIRYRRRYLDLIANPEVVEVFRKRAALIRRTRRFLDERGFLEVETPALQPIYGGASARPFTTHHNALDMKLYLRIADELYLKRLIVGGLEKVYEIAKDFRNEGIDRTHNPEFTQLELYEAFRDYNDMMALVEDLLRELALELCGTTRIVYGGKEADLGRPWRRLSFVDALSERLGRPALETDEAELRRALARSGVEIPEDASVGGLMDKLFETWIEPGLEEPTFVIDHPKAISPLAKERPDRPGVVERFEPFLFGIEIGNAFSELNDPVEQRRRFEGQKRLAGVEGEEAQQMDEDFLRAVEHGMPPTGGLGLGIDRIAMILTDQPSIRDVLLFPQLRPEVPE